VTQEELDADDARVLQNRAGSWHESTASATLTFAPLRNAAADAAPQVIVSLRGYAPTRVRLAGQSQSQLDSEDPIEVLVDLEPGHGASIVVLDGESAAETDPVEGHRSSCLAGARVRSNGRVIGTTDELGLALCRSDRPIRSIEIELKGWVAVERRDIFGRSAFADDGQAIVYMVRSD